MVESLFRDGTACWVRIVNEIDKNVNETSETISLENLEHGATGKPVAKAKPRPKPVVTLSYNSIPFRERKWIDVNPERFRKDCFTMSKAMIRLLRHHPSIPREDYGAARFDEIMKEFEAKFDGASQWSINDWMSYLAKGGGPKKRFQYCSNPHSSKHLLYFKAIHRHSGGNLVDPALQDNVLLSEDFTEYIYQGVLLYRVLGQLEKQLSGVEAGIRSTTWSSIAFERLLQLLFLLWEIFAPHESVLLLRWLQGAPRLRGPLFPLSILPAPAASAATGTAFPP